MPLVGAYTLFNTLKTCAHQTYRRYVKRDLKFKESPESRWGNSVHSAMEYRVGGGKVLPPEMAAFEPFAAAFDGRGALVETQLGATKDGKVCDFFGNGVYVRGKLDVVVVQGSVAYIGDWKTNKTIWEDPIELKIHAALLQVWQPTIQTIHGQYHWLTHAQAGKLYDLSNTSEAWGMIQGWMTELADREREGRWEKRQNKLCPWCNVHDCEFSKGDK